MIFLANVTKVNPNGTIEAESQESPEVIVNAQIMTPQFWFWKPRVGDVVVMAKTNQNHFLCLGTLYPNHQEWMLLDPNNTNGRFVRESHFISVNSQVFNDVLIPS